VCVLGSGGELVSGDGKEAPRADLLGVRLLHAGDDVDGRLRRHRLRDADWSLLHGLLHTRCSCKLPSNRCPHYRQQQKPGPIWDFFKWGTAKYRQLYSSSDNDGNETNNEKNHTVTINAIIGD